MSLWKGQITTENESEDGSFTCMPMAPHSCQARRMISANAKISRKDAEMPCFAYCEDNFRRWPWLPFFWELFGRLSCLTGVNPPK